MFPAPYVHDDYAGGVEDIIIHALLLTLACRIRLGPRVMYLDTHSGAGLYRLGQVKARRRDVLRHSAKAFYKSDVRTLPLQLLRSRLKKFNSFGNDLRAYIGSPILVHSVVKPSSAVFCEREPRVANRLRRTAQRCAAGATVRTGDGFEVALEYCRAHRGERLLVFVDPAFESIDGHIGDYAKIRRLLLESELHPRTVFAVTYPLARDRDQSPILDLLDELRAAGLTFTVAEMTFPPTNVGLCGAGLLTINGPRDLPIVARRTLCELRDIFRVTSSKVRTAGSEHQVSIQRSFSRF